MAELFLLSDVQMRSIEPFFPRSRGLTHVDDWRVISGIAYVIRCGLQWRAARRGYSPHKTLCNRLCTGAALACSSASSRPWATAAGEPDRPMMVALQQKQGARAINAVDGVYYIFSSRLR